MTVNPADVPKMYKDIQIKSALVAEKEKNLSHRRVALAELKQQVDKLEQGVLTRQSTCSGEAGKLEDARRKFEEKKAVREGALRAQQERIAEMEQEENSMRRQMVRMDKQIAATLAEIQELRSESTRLDAAEDEIAQLRMALRKDIAEFDEYEKKVVAAEKECLNRHDEFAKENDTFPLTTVADAMEMQALAHKAQSMGLGDESCVFAGTSPMH
jgi:chromosome segregation ATPase